jgi:hypothetical protein
VIDFGAGRGSFSGLISGSVPYEPSANKCPKGAPGHWDNILLGTSGLNKDEPSRNSHDQALDFARRQIHHEWCRLVNLVKTSSGGIRQ